MELYLYLGQTPQLSILNTVATIFFFSGCFWLKGNNCLRDL